MITIYHNPRCSKSRETLALLEARGIAPRIVRYLDTPPTAAELAQLCRQLAIAPRALLREAEDEYRLLNLADAGLGDQQLLAAMAAHPKLIQRPIVVNGARAALGRPPEAVLDIL